MREKKVGEWIKEKACDKYAEFEAIGILPDKKAVEKSSVKKGILELQAKYAGRLEAERIIEEYMRCSMKAEWYLSKRQYEINLEEAIQYHKRLAKSLKQKEVIDKNKPFLYSIKETVVKGTVNLIVKDEKGKVTAILLCDRAAFYNRRARIQWKRPEYAPELLLMYLGLHEIYGRELQLQMIFLKREKDDPQLMFDGEKQIISADYSKTDIKKLEERLESAISYWAEERKKNHLCEQCRFKLLCRKRNKIAHPQMEIRKPEPKFTIAQQQVVDLKEGTCAVYAVPGAGKTTTLVYRLCRLLSNGVDPENILFVTFTNKAAMEIRDRVQAILDTKSTSFLPQIYTFNGLGWQIIRDHEQICGSKKLLTPMEEKRLLLECIDESEPLIGFRYQYIEGKFGLLNQLGKVFQGLKENEEEEIDKLVKAGRNLEQILMIYEKYKKKIEEEGYITYDEQITLAIEILKQNPQVRKEYQSKWQYIMADEFQDASKENVELLYLIAKEKSPNIVVVGDADQSIYEWRNGSPKYLIEFPEIFPNTRKIYMQDNFRSTDQILESSNQLIALNQNRVDIFMRPHKKGAARPYRIRNADVTKVPEIVQLLKDQHYEYGDIAILARKNVTLDKCRKVLEEKGIESISPADRFCLDPMIVFINDILKLYQDLTCDMELYRAFRMLHCRLKKPNIEKSFYDTLREKGYQALDTGNIESMLVYMVEKKDEKEDPILNAAKVLFRLFLKIEEGNLKHFLDAVENALGMNENDPAIQALLRFIDQQNITTIEELEQELKFLETIGDESTIEYDADPDKVLLMTAHGSKGKEFPVVLILECESFEETEEERRLLYVAMTRAEKVLYLLESPGAHCILLDQIADSVQSVVMEE